MMARVTYLEDFGVRKTATAQERLEEYKKQKLSAKAWEEALRHDREVAKIVEFKPLGVSRRSKLKVEGE